MIAFAIIYNPKLILKSDLSVFWSIDGFIFTQIRSFHRIFPELGKIRFSTQTQCLAVTAGRSSVDYHKIIINVGANGDGRTREKGFRKAFLVTDLIGFTDNSLLTNEKHKKLNSCVFAIQLVYVGVPPNPLLVDIRINQCSPTIIGMATRIRFIVIPVFSIYSQHACSQDGITG